MDRGRATDTAHLVQGWHHFIEHVEKRASERDPPSQGFDPDQRLDEAVAPVGEGQRG